MTIPNILQPIDTLPPGSSAFTLQGLTPATQYVAGVQQVEQLPHTGITPGLIVKFTTLAGTSVCAAPDDPVPFVLGFGGGSQSICGVAAFNNEPVDGTVLHFEMATEVLIGGGQYTTFADQGHVLSLPFSWAVFKISLAVDLRRRQFRVKAVRPGVLDSAYTPIVTLQPGVALTPADYPVPVPRDMNISAVGVVSPTGMTVALASAYTPPTDHDFDHFEYKVEASLSAILPGLVLYGAPQTVIGGSDGSDYIGAPPAGIYRVTPIAVTTGETGALVGQGITISPTRSTGNSVVVTVPKLSNLPTIVAASVDTTNVTYTLKFDVGTAWIRVYSEQFASDPGTVDSVELPANLVPPDLDPTKNVLKLPVTSGLPYRVSTFVPYSGAGARGVPETIKSVRPGSATAPAAPTLTMLKELPSWALAKVSFNTTPTAGDTLTFFRGGIQVAGQYIITAADVTAGFATLIDDSVTFPGTFSYQATQTSSTGTSVLSTAVNFIISVPYVLHTPFITAVTGPNGGKLITPFFNADNTTPPSAVFNITYSYSGFTDPNQIALATNAPLGSGPFTVFAPKGSLLGVVVDITTVVSCPAGGYTDSAGHQDTVTAGGPLN